MAIPLKKLAIIGGGPAGLICAKEAISVGMRPTIFELSSHIGGMWNSKSSKTWKSNLRTNLSKFTCCFSGCDWWDSVNIYPRGIDVQMYLEKFSEEFIPNGCLMLDVKVTMISRQQDNCWKVDWQSKNEKGHSSDVFDFITVCSGFFSSPSQPSWSIWNEFKGKLIHSSQYKDPKEFSDKVVVVCGSSFSAVDITTEISHYARKVIHLSPHSVCVLPRYIPLTIDAACSPLLPIDMVFYRRSRRASPEEVLFKSEVDLRRSRAYFAQLTGHATEVDCADPVFVAISDSYSALVNAGRVELIRGRAVGFTAEGSLQYSESKSNDSNQSRDTSSVDVVRTLSAVDAVVLTTGYKPDLGFLPSWLLRDMEFDQSDVFCPLLLDRDMFHPSAPGLAFVGMYRGPYFATMELQAVRLLRRLR